MNPLAGGYRTLGAVVEVSESEFEELVSDALDSIPPELAAAVDNVVVLVEDEPAPEDEGLFGLYEGTPVTERGEWYGGVLPDTIRLFRGPLQRHCGTRAELVDEVRITVVHEIAHYFGIDDDRLHELGWG
ncbi:MAG TPA: metallopeptidase family protein [Jiangellaceae bacterium]|nr:metallopeptidase family protein [Jiangellaceae bacterium]